MCIRDRDRAVQALQQRVEELERRLALQTESAPKEE